MTHIFKFLDELGDFKHFSEKVKFWKNYKCFDPFCMGKNQFSIFWWGIGEKILTSDKNLSTSDGQIFVPSDVLVFPSDVLALAIKLVYKSSASMSEK